MLQRLYTKSNETSFKLMDIQEILVFGTCFLKNCVLEIIKLTNGYSLIFPKSKYIYVETYGYNYFKNQNLKLKSKVEKNSISRIALCYDTLFHRRLIEIIELKDGTIYTNILTKFIIGDKVDKEYLFSFIR